MRSKLKDLQSSNSLGFRPDKIPTDLVSYRDWLESLPNILTTNNKSGADQMLIRTLTSLNVINIASHHVALIKDSLHDEWFFMLLLSSADFFKINIFKNVFQLYHQTVKQFGSRPGPTLCRSWSGPKLFARIVSMWQKSPLAITR